MKAWWNQKAGPSTSEIAVQRRRAENERRRREDQRVGLIDAVLDASPRERADAIADLVFFEGKLGGLHTFQKIISGHQDLDGIGQEYVDRMKAASTSGISRMRLAKEMVLTLQPSQLGFRKVGSTDDFRPAKKQTKGFEDGIWWANSPAGCVGTLRDAANADRHIFPFVEQFFSADADGRREILKTLQGHGYERTGLYWCLQRCHAEQFVDEVDQVQAHAILEEAEPVSDAPILDLLEPHSDEPAPPRRGNDFYDAGEMIG